MKVNTGRYKYESTNTCYPDVILRHNPLGAHSITLLDSELFSETLAPNILSNISNYIIYHRDNTCKLIVWKNMIKDKATNNK